MQRKWHRRAGISVFIFLLIFITTGLAIQHASWLELDEHYVASSLILKLYGVTVDTSTDFRTQHHWISHAGEFLYLDGAPVASIRLSQLQGAVENGALLWIAGDNKLWLLRKQGELLDELSLDSGLPDIASKLGVDETGSIVISGLKDIWSVDEELSEWQLYAGIAPSWSKPSEASAMPPKLKQKILDHARSYLISWERLLLDLHSGRLFGLAGIIVADIAAFLLLALSITGFVLWIRSI